MNLDSKFHPINVGFQASDEEGVYCRVVGEYSYCIYVSSYIYQDKKGFEHTIKVNRIDGTAAFSISIELLKKNRNFYEVVGSLKDIPARFQPIVDYAKQQYRQKMIDEILTDLK